VVRGNGVFKAHRLLYSTLGLRVMCRSVMRIGRRSAVTENITCGTEASSYLRLIDSCITQLKVQGPSRTCNESKEEEGTSPVASVWSGAMGYVRLIDICITQL